MHKIIYSNFEKIVSNIKCKNVVEIGTPNKKEESLLFLESLNNANKTGIDLAGPYCIDGINVIKADATKMPFDNDSFDLILCNSVLEHEPNFWLAIDEFKRVLITGGTLIIGVPAFTKKHNTVLQYHAFPEDYYRFSAAAVKNMFSDEFDSIKTIEVMIPPRIICWGVKT
jgi:SAM-dependent methyltransferase